jgi:hypothetical protein
VIAVRILAKSTPGTVVPHSGRARFGAGGPFRSFFLYGGNGNGPPTSDDRSAAALPTTRRPAEPAGSLQRLQHLPQALVLDRQRIAKLRSRQRLTPGQKIGERQLKYSRAWARDPHARAHSDRTADLPRTGPSTTTSQHALIAPRGPRFPRPLGLGPGSILDRPPSGSASGRGGSADASSAWAGVAPSRLRRFASQRSGSSSSIRLDGCVFIPSDVVPVAACAARLTRREAVQVEQRGALARAVGADDRGRLTRLDAAQSLFPIGIAVFQAAHPRRT